MSVLVINETTRVRIREAKAYATSCIREMITTQEDKALAHPYPDDLSNPQVVPMTMGFIAGYSIDRLNGLLYHHISVLTNNPHRVPNHQALQLILAAFDMALPSAENQGRLWVTEVKPNIRAVNIINRYT